jgi:hypothetical protein
MEYDGGDIPPGYHTETRPRAALAIAGGSILGGGWIISVLAAATYYSDTGSHNDQLWGLFIPVAGPWITLAATGTSNNGGAPILILDGVGQAAGLGFLIAGLAARKTVLVRDSAAVAAKSKGPELFIGAQGASLRGTF